MLHTAWKDRPSIALNVLARNAFLTATGIVLLGFVIYQFYYAMYRPVVHLGFWRLRKTVRVHDRGGAILDGLSDIDGAFDRIRESQRIDGSIGFLERGKPDDDTYAKQWYRNAHAVRCLANSIAVSGDGEIKKEYSALTDIYHALGACRIAVAMAVATTFAHVATTGLPRYEANLPASVAATFCCLAVGWLTMRVCQRNRRDSWHTLTRQLRGDLRLWYLRNGDSLLGSQLASQNGHAPAFRQRLANLVESALTYRL